MKPVLALVATLAIAATQARAAPAPEDIEAYRALVALDKRLATTGYRLARANAPFCKQTWRNPGWVLHSDRQYGDRDIARAAFAFPTPVAIAAIVDGGPAEKAGLHAGDGLLDMDGGIWWPGEPVKHKANSELLDGIEARLNSAFAASKPVKLTFGGFDQAILRRSVTLDPPRACASHFVVSTGGKADAGADGKRVRISAKLVEFAGDEDEFAFLVAHELSHNILAHRKYLDEHDVQRGIGRMFGKSKKLIRETEVEADRLAVWLMANAGYDVDAAPRFIERYGRKYGQGIFSDGTHYRWKKRKEIVVGELRVLALAKRNADGLKPPLLNASNAQE